MGNDLSYLNISSIRVIVHTTRQDIFNILELFEGRPMINNEYYPPPDKETVAALKMKYYVEANLHPRSKFVGSFQNIAEISRQHSYLGNSNRKDFMCSLDEFQRLISYDDLEFTESDIDLLVTLYKLVDKRGYSYIDIRHVLICFVVIVASDAVECMDMALQIFDRQNSKLILKEDLFDVLVLLNESCLYFGDKHLPISQINDLIDSVFASAGRIDGEIFYPDYIETIAQHPLVELFLSPQFQGNNRSKILDDEQIATTNVMVRIS